MEDVLKGVVAVYKFEKYLDGGFVDLSYITTTFHPILGDKPLFNVEKTSTTRRYKTEKREIFADFIDKEFAVDEKKLQVFLHGQRIALISPARALYNEDDNVYNAILAIDIGKWVNTDRGAGRRITFTTANLPFPVDEIVNLLCQRESDARHRESKRNMEESDWRREVYEMTKHLSPLDQIGYLSICAKFAK